MQVKNPTKLTTVLLASTVMATTLVWSEAAHGAQSQKRYQEQLRIQEEAKHKAALTTLGGSAAKYKDALKDPATALGGPAAPGNLTQATDNAVLVVGSAALAHAGHVGTNAEKIAALEAIDGASAAGTDDVANSEVRTALGLDPNPLNYVATKPEVTTFINAAKERLVRLPDKTAKAGTRKAAVADLQKYANAIANPHAALGGGQPLYLAFAAAALINPSASLGMPLGTADHTVAALRAIETAHLHHGGGVGIIDNDNAKAAIRTALGIDPAPAQFLATGPQVLTFLIIAGEDQINNVMLAGIVGAVPTIDKIEDIRTRLAAAQYRGDNGVNVGAGGAHDTIAVSLTRLGL
jgi:hypothetical protein